MGRPTNAEIAARNAASEPAEDNQDIQLDNGGVYEPENDGLEEFEQPTPKVSADEPTPNGKTKIRVLPKGDGKIATGHFDRQLNSFTYHKKGDHLFVHPGIAKTQEDNGLAEIIE